MTTETVPRWPRIVAVVNRDATGRLSVNGTERECAAESVDALRAGVIARCVAVAVTMGRPVQLLVSEDGVEWALAVRPNGVVQPLNDDGTVDPPGDVVVAESRCRACRHLQPVTAAVCSACGVDEPLAVEVAAAEPAPSGAEPQGPPPAEHPSAPSDAARSSVVDPLGRRGEHRPTAPAPTTPTAPALRLTFPPQTPIVVGRAAVIGRKPDAVGGRQAVSVESPRRMLSRTHLLVDLDDQGRILVTDHHSGNGTYTQGEVPLQLAAGQPYVVAAGTTLLLGDVLCTLDVTG
ncbi:FHA domain-containing protein [Cellulomonas sp.]|uniref:FHA domain-containing protein n=1 Tax=Cellulomonas sp. TaxID=40001 RepID=UPI001B17D7BD|nr:FHA domain-containing protein [Cellulomonas sp.]MBO9553821.1 FHA domain-containing protein [Cellulomonas sp.]